MVDTRMIPKLKKDFMNRFDIDKKIHGVFELHRKRIKEDEFTESQLDIWFGDKESV